MATTTRRLGAEDLWRLARPAQPTLSPDGAQVCVSVTTYDMEENKGRSKLWLLSTFGGAPRPLTEAGEKDGEPRWSPDGTRIAFVAKRDKDEEPQLWLIAPDGGEARRVTRMPTGVSGIKWFPDSRRVAFISWVWPDAVGYKALEARYKEHKDSKVKAHVVEHEAYRYWDHWLSDGRVPRLFVVDVETQRITDLFAGTPYELPCADPAAHHYDIAPGRARDRLHLRPGRGEALRPRVPRRRPRPAGEALPHAHARARASTTTSPSYSPDGKWLALLTRNLRRSPVAEARIAILDRATRAPEGVSRCAGTAACTRPWPGRATRRRSSSPPRTAPATHAFRWRAGRAGARGGRAGRHGHGLRRAPATRSPSCATP